MTTQDHLPIKEIHDDVVILNDGSITVVMQTSAVNFDLLSENEQLAIISTFAAMLNSLSFPIQIVIRSTRLDISSYLKSLVDVENLQQNPLLKQMIQRYRVFIETIIRENEVLDKQFYLVLSVSSLELGIGGTKEQKFQKALTILNPRRDHIIRQISRIGLKVEQLNNQQLIKLFYDLYNEKSQPLPTQDQTQESGNTQLPQSTQPPVGPTQPIQPDKNVTTPTNPPSAGTPPTAPTTPLNTPTPAAASPQPTQPQRTNYSSPFIVEELKDEYSSV